MDINFVKWMCEKADGFEMIDHPKIKDHNMFISPYSNIIFHKDSFPIDNPLISLLVYPLLLQMSIDGVNRKSYFSNGRFEIVLRRWGIQLMDYSTDRHEKVHWRYEKMPGQYSTQAPKEQALRYIYEQEEQ